MGTATRLLVALAVLVAACTGGRSPAQTSSTAAAEPASCAEQDLQPSVPDGYVLVFFGCTAPEAHPAQLYPVLRRVSEDTPAMVAAVTALVAGPTPEELRQGFIATLAGLGNVRLRTAKVDARGFAVVDLTGLPPEVPTLLNGFHPPGIQAELAWTVFEADLGVRVVEFRLDGSCEAFWRTVAETGCRQVTAEEWAQV